MPSISETQFGELLRTFERESLHLEARDAYGTETELPYMAKWASGEPDDLAWLADWCATVRSRVSTGAMIRRARIVSEPLSSYQRWSYSIAHPMVDAGKDIRWIPRRLVSSIGIPGNDFYLFDGRLVVFLIYTGDGLNAAYETSTDPADVALCRSAFQAVWKVAVPHGEYQPQ